MDKTKFNRGQFETAFAITIETLANAESITRRELRNISRDILTAIHCTEDSAFLNRLINVLTPVNKKVMVHYLSHFSGFHYDDKSEMFTKKNKPYYAKALALSTEFLAEPHNNVWTWAERNIDITPKPFDVSAITKYMQGALKKAMDNGLTQKDVMKAVFASGLEVDSLFDVLDELGYETGETTESPKAEPDRTEWPFPSE